MPASAQDIGIIEGVVDFVGIADEQTYPDMKSDPVCADMYTTEGLPLRGDLVVNSNSTLKNVVVYVTAGFPDDKSWDLTSGTVNLEQSRCRFIPRILPIQAGQTVQLVNSDPTLSNFHWRSLVNKSTNQTLLPQSESGDAIRFTKPESPFMVSNAIQPWMRSYIAVFEHPYFAVTDEEGRFRIEGLPQGDYTVEAWHELYHTVTLQSVLVRKETPAKIRFTYTRTGASNAAHD